MWDFSKHFLALLNSGYFEVCHERHLKNHALATGGIYVLGPSFLGGKSVLQGKRLSNLLSHIIIFVLQAIGMTFSSLLGVRIEF